MLERPKGHTVFAGTKISNATVRVGPIIDVSVKSKEGERVDWKARAVLIIAGLLLGEADRGEDECGDDGEVLHCERMVNMLTECFYYF